MATAELTRPEATELVPTAKTSLATFSVTLAKAKELKAECLAIKLANLHDEGSMQLARSKRLEVKAKRVALDKERIGKKAEAMTVVNLVDSTARAIRVEFEAGEEHLQKQEDDYNGELERIKQEAFEQNQRNTQARVDEIFALGFVPNWHVLEALSVEEYAAELAKCQEKKRKIDEQAAAEEAERQRVKAEEDAKRKADQEQLDAERAELERKQEEDRKLRQEEEAKAAEHRRAEQAKIDAENERLEGIRKQQEAKQAELDAAQKKLDDANAAEQRKIHEEQEQARLARETRIARETAEREAAEQAKAKAEAEAAEKARQEALKPDREKILVIAGLVDAIAVPALSESAMDCACEISAMLKRTANEIRVFAENL